MKDGKLFWGGEPVAVRRAVVGAVMGKSEEPVTEENARRMIAMERALSLAGLAAMLARAQATR